MEYLGSFLLYFKDIFDMIYLIRGKRMKEAAMSRLIKIDDSYAAWIEDLSKRFRSVQVKAATKVNDEMLRFYWSVGRDITGMKFEDKYGSGFLKNVSMDLREAFPNQHSFSVSNIRYMRRFYQLYSKLSIQFKENSRLGTNLPQVGEDLNNDVNVPQPGEDLESKANVPQLGEHLFMVPWGHHKCIIDKCSGNVDKALFYVRQTIENSWSRSVLLNFISTDLYERQGRAVSNFREVLPMPQGDLAQEITKDPYNFDFITITQRYNEKELKDALQENIVKFLMELGSGFAFVGREYRLEIGSTEKFLDLLFYNIKLHCYVVVEVKTDKFESEYIGQLGTYVAAVNHILKGLDDNPTIGLLICKEKDNVLAQYAVESSSEPIGISEYELSKIYPADFKGSLPSIEDIERQLG